MSSTHHWQFFRAGGVDQVVIRTGADIANIGQLDQKLWVALACPTRGIEFDPRTLDLIDTDRDGRIRPPELIAACEWACAHVKDVEELMRGGDEIALDAIADGPRAGDGAATDTPLADEARRILQLRGRPDATTLALADVTDRAELLDAMRFNGDGIVPPESADDEPVRDVLRLIMKTQGPARDRNGLDGANRAQAEAFFTQARSLHAWRTGAAALGGDRGAAGGEALLATAQSLGAVREKVDDFFALCRLAAYDPGAVTALNPSAAHYEALALREPALRSEGIARLPLAPVRADRTLPLCHGVNPAWADALGNLRRDAAWLLPEPDAESIDERTWEALKDRVQSCQQWLAARPETRLGALSAVDVEAALAQEEAVLGLIESDERIEPHNARLADLEKLLRFKRDLLALLNNFVAFKAFYRREGAIFQAGTLYLDGRSCELSVEVADASRHAALAGLAKAYLAYCLCTRQGKTMTIVSAFTAGDVDFLFVGRNGVFYDRQGRDWDATITKVIENPTSVGQAFLSPYKKFLRMIEEQVARRAATSDALTQDSLGTLASTLATADKATAAGGAAKPGATAAAAVVAATPSPLRLPARIDVGTVAALGVALGSISAVLVGIFAKFVDLGQWIPVAVVGIVIAISGPSMLIAWLKLRQRSLGPILDASGWAINGRMHVNVRLGGSLSQTAHLPANAKRSLRDPYAGPNGWAGAVMAIVIVGVLAALSWRLGWLDSMLPAFLRHSPPATAAAPTAGAVAAYSGAKRVFAVRQELVDLG